MVQKSSENNPADLLNSTSICEALSTTTSDPPVLASPLPDDETIALHLVQDLLDCLNLTYTSSVFRSEIGNRLDSQSTIRELLQIENHQFDETELMSAHDISERIDGSGRSDLDEDSLECSVNDDKRKLTQSRQNRKPMLITVLQRFAGFISNNRNDSSGASTSTCNGGEDGAINNETFISNVAEGTFQPNLADVTSESL